ncbi:two-component system sensor histidine kinase RegB [Archangium gephyra]|uniref:histidine kinase n=1 Tax=Archangium gephyra TaxID=48 RepID=A0AAC8QHX6_9BACT|nr:ATP-binding protein [Archangium gephyra]AKJ07814.1 Sensor histidine kinase PrrB [Archangium gephyra]REG29566.1 two-component system sensor histidine kinase RegB [Archangium gephyra]
MRDAQAINLSWLLRLRWGAVVGQAAIILGVHFGLGMTQRLVPLFVTIAVAAASNVALGLWARRERRIRERLLWAVMALDVVLLTVLLDLSGGPFNPFSALYLVHIALAAVVLRAGWTWALTGLAIGCFGALFVDHLWFPSTGGELASAHHPQHHIHDVRMHLEGMWAAFALAAGFIVYFVQRVTRALAAREAELVEARAAAARHEKLTALGTLAAGAAHELSTPLSTIAVAARELERQLTRTGSEAATLEDVQLIRQQVARCRDILTQMTLDAGASQGESMVERAPAALVEEALEGLPERERVRTELDARTREERELVPAHAFARAIRGVVKNALQASGPGKPVRLGLVREAAGWRLTVEDSGEGMPAEVLARAGEPFFTTKAPGEGMGLGLFLTRAVLEQLGGGLVLRSTPGQGTTVVLTWPAGGLRQSAALPAGASRVKPGT